MSADRAVAAPPTAHGPTSGEQLAYDKASAARAWRGWL